jgi:ABC transport system ATP-binding/permease protein
LEAREFASIEDRVTAAEELVARERAVVEDPAVATDAVRLQAALLAMEQAQQALDDLYTRWAELEAKSV